MRVDAIVPSDFIIVPGGSQSRARFAACCFHEGIAPRILVTGRDDASINHDLLIKLGVPPSAIFVESDSRSTLENARFSAPILRKTEAQTVTIVTSLYHSSRALATFHHELPAVRFVSLPMDCQFDKDSFEPHYARLEVVKRVWYFVRYGIPIAGREF